MSDTSEDTGRQSDKEDCVCRDFVRGICDRKFCKYKHENDTRSLNFCHDYQNSICTRPHCKFIHCTPEEVEEYKSTGQMSPQIIVEASRKHQLPGSVPICKEFKKGSCRRNFCKYRHITKEQEEAELLEMIHNNNNNRIKPIIFTTNTNESQLIGSLNGTIRRNGVSFDDYAEDGLPALKRRLLAAQDAELLSCDILEQNRPIFRGYFAGNPPSPMVRAVVDARLVLLEKENGMLHKEIAQLKRQVSDLTATNEFLLDQNANLRVSGKRNGTVPGAVTISAPPSTPAQPRQVIASVATVPVSLATVSTIAECPTVSIATPQPQLLAASNQQILVTTNPSSQLAIANSNQAQLAIAQQNLANNLAQQAQPQLTSQAQQLALATTTQQLTSQAQHMANQQAQQIANQQMALASAPQQLTSSQAQQLANQQLTSQAQQLALASTNQQFTMASVPQQLTLAGTNQQLIAQQNLASSQQLELHRNSQINAINTSQAIAMSNASQPMVSYPIMTQQTITHALSH